MKGKAFLIPLVLMVVGFATVSTSLSINGIANVYNELNGYDVYFSDVRVDGVQDWTTVDNKTVLTFTPDFDDGDYVLEYDVTNASEQYDSNVNVTCTSESNNVIVKNDYDSSTNLEARETRIAKVTVESRWIFNDIDNSGSITVGDEYTFENESFTVIAQTNDKVTMLAKYNLGIDYRQSTTANPVTFANVNGWEFSPGPKEIDIQKYEGNTKTYVNSYVSYLKEQNEVSSIDGSLITLSQLKKLGCSIIDDYSYSDGLTCSTSKYAEWLVNGQYWWTRSVTTGNDYDVWGVRGDGILDDYNYSVADSGYGGGIRPVVEISKDVLNSALVTCVLENVPIENDVLGVEEVPNSVETCQWIYTDTDGSETLSIGDEYAYCNEKFNVISFNSTSVRLFAKYNLWSSYRQYNVDTGYGVSFSDMTGWTYTPGPNQITIQNYEGNAKRYINRYVSFLNNEIGETVVSGDLISLEDLSKLGCTGITSNYSYAGTETCLNSKYADWLINGQYSWTRSSSPDYYDRVWHIQSDGLLNHDYSSHNICGIRPVITISRGILPEPEVSLITFTIDNVEYYSMPGWDWDTWIKSDFNTIGITYHDCGAISGSTGHVFNKSDYMEVSSTATIIDGGSYFIAGMFHCMPQDI